MTNMLALLLTIALCNGLELIVYSGIFIYSFRRKPKFVLRILLSVLGIGGICVGMAYAFNAGLGSGAEVTIKTVEVARIISNVLTLGMGIGFLFFCFDEKPALLLFATVSANALHILGSMTYEASLAFTDINSIYFTVYNGYSVLSFVVYYVVHLGILALGYFFFGRAFAKATKIFDKTVNRTTVGMFVFFAFFMVGLSGSSVFRPIFNGSDLPVQFVFDVGMIVFSGFVLFVQRSFLYWIKTAQEKEAEERFHEDYRQHSLRQQKNLALIKDRTLDVKEQIRTILEKQNVDVSFLDEMQNGLPSGSIRVDTGNKTLDKVFAQKTFACNIHGIRMSAMIEGDLFGFMSAADINAFFGNAIDNAVEYLESVEEEDRFIRISSYRNVNVLTVRIENFCNTKVNFSPVTGLPMTTNVEKNFHGFGTQTIRKIAEKYGGVATFRRESDLFVVSALFVM